MVHSNKRYKSSFFYQLAVTSRSRRNFVDDQYWWHVDHTCQLCLGGQLSFRRAHLCNTISVKNLQKRTALVAFPRFSVALFPQGKKKKLFHAMLQKLWIAYPQERKNTNSHKWFLNIADIAQMCDWLFFNLRTFFPERFFFFSFLFWIVTKGSFLRTNETKYSVKKCFHTPWFFIWHWRLIFPLFLVNCYT